MHGIPPPLANRGAVKSGVKFVILDCLQAPKGTIDMTEEFIIVLLDMADIVHMIPPTRATTFKEYTNIHNTSYVKGIPQLSTTRIDEKCLCENIYRSLPFFHALGSCNTISQLSGIGKNTT